MQPVDVRFDTAILLDQYDYVEVVLHEELHSHSSDMLSNHLIDVNYFASPLCHNRIVVLVRVEQGGVNQG